MFSLGIRRAGIFVLQGSRFLSSSGSALQGRTILHKPNVFAAFTLPRVRNITPIRFLSTDSQSPSIAQLDALDRRLSCLPRVPNTSSKDTFELIRKSCFGDQLKPADLAQLRGLLESGDMSKFVDCLDSFKTSNQMISQWELFQDLVSSRFGPSADLLPKIIQLIEYLAQSPADQHRVDEGFIGACLKYLLDHKATKAAFDLSIVAEKHGLSQVDLRLLDKLARQMQDDPIFKKEILDVLRLMKKLEDRYSAKKKHASNMIDQTTQQTIMSALQGLSPEVQNVLQSQYFDESDESDERDESDDEESEFAGSNRKRDPNRRTESLDSQENTSDLSSVKLEINLGSNSTEDLSKIYQLANILREQGAHEQTYQLIQLFGEESPFQKDRNFVANILACMTASQESVEKGFQVFEQEYPDAYPDVITYNYFLSLLSATGSVKEMQDIFRRMEKAHNIHPNRTSYHHMMTAYSQADQLEMMMRYFLEMKAMSIEPDTNTCSIVVDAYLRQDAHEKALEFIDEMKLDGITLDCRPFGSVINYYLDQSKLKDALQTFFSMSRSSPQMAGVNPDISLYNSLMEECIVSEDLNGSNLLYQACIRDPRVFPQATTFEIMLGVAAENESFCDAATYVRDMRSFGIEPTIDIFERTMTILIDAGKQKEALQLFDIACRRFEMVSIDLWNLAITARCGYEGMKAAKQQLKEMRANQVLPNIFSYNALISSCKPHEIEDAISTYEWIIQQSNKAIMDADKDFSDDEYPSVKTPKKRSANSDTQSGSKFGAGTRNSNPGTVDANKMDDYDIDSELEAQFSATLDAKLREWKNRNNSNEISSTQAGSISTFIKSEENEGNGKLYDTEESLFPGADSENIEANAETFFAIIQACERAKNFKYFEKVLDDAIQYFVSPEPSVFCEILRACFRSGQHTLAQDYLKRVEKNAGNKHTDISVWSTILQGLGNRLTKEELMNIYEKGKQTNQDETELHLTYIMVCGMHRDLRQGFTLIVLLDKSKTLNIRDSIHSFMIGASARGRHDVIDLTLNQVEKTKMELQDEQHHFFITAHAYTQDSASAANYLSKLKASNQPIGPLTYQAMMFVCCEDTNSDGQLGLETLREMTQRHPSPNNPDLPNIDPYFMRHLVAWAQEQPTGNPFAAELLRCKEEFDKRDSLAIEEILRILGE